MNEQDTTTGSIEAGAATATLAEFAPGQATSEHAHLDSSTIGKLRELVLAAAEPIHLGNTSSLLVPEGYKHVDLTAAVEKAGPYPTRKAGTVIVSDLDSFLRYVADHGAPSGTYIFADPEARTLTAVLNEHVRDVQGAPGWRDFRVVYKAELSREFATWFALNKKPMDQEEFAIFLEDNIADVVEPSGETLLKIALTLQAKTEVNFSSAKRLDNGQFQLTYNETIDARAGSDSMEIPREFAIGCRLFKNADGYRVKARLKYRLIAGGKVKFWYEMDRPENAIEQAFEAHTEQARAGNFTVLVGKA